MSKSSNMKVKSLSVFMLLLLIGSVLAMMIGCEVELEVDDEAELCTRRTISSISSLARDASALAPMMSTSVLSPREGFTTLIREPAQIDIIAMKCRCVKGL